MKTEETFTSLIAAAHAGMEEYVVVLYAEPGDNALTNFTCWAEDSIHAGEQALNAYPYGELIRCECKTKEEPLLGEAKHFKFLDSPPAFNNHFFDKMSAMEMMYGNPQAIKKTHFTQSAMVKAATDKEWKMVMLNFEADMTKFEHSMHGLSDAMMKFGLNAKKLGKVISLDSLASLAADDIEAMQLAAIEVADTPKSRNQERREALAKLPGNRKKMRY